MLDNHDYFTDILIVGGSTGGCAAAMAATSLGCRAVLTEETDWLGGQLTSQAVPPDEHRWIEQCGCTGRYRRFRDEVRRFYQAHHPLTAEAAADPQLNPGQGRVSKLCHEPRVALHVIESMLAFARSSGRLDVRLRRKPVAATTEGDRITSVTLRHLDTGEEETLTAPYVLDATELGDLLALANVEYVTGAESQAEHGEPHARAGDAEPDAVQAITWCFPLAYDPTPGADHTSDCPAQYAFWREYVPEMTPAWTGPLFAWSATNPFTLGRRPMALFPEDAQRVPGGAFSMWHYRRILHADHYRPGQRPHEVTCVNWPQNDYWLDNIIDKPDEVVARCLEGARQMSLSLVHWLQTEAPRPDGGEGYRGLYLRPDMTGTPDGLAKAPYVREARRIRAVFTVTENHVGTEARGGINVVPHQQPRVLQPAGLRAEPFHDAIGVGHYRIDLHPDTAGRNYVDVASLPFQIPLGALLPVRLMNLLPACKNIGTTHITNGCYRLHPVEWNIGEAAGLLAAFCLKRHTRPHAVREKQDLLDAFQQLLRDQEIELEWPAPVLAEDTQPMPATRD